MPVRLQSIAGSLREQFALTRIAQRLGASLIHSHFGPVGWRDILPSRLAGTAHIVTFYGMDLAKVPRTDARWISRYRGLFATIDLVLCEGEHMSSQLRNLGCPEHKIRVHRLGIQLDSARLVPRSRSLEEPHRVLMAASFREKKGYPYGLEAVRNLLGQFDIQLTIAGDGTPEERVHLQKTIARLGLVNRVRMIGMVSHTTLLEEAYRHHVFLSPSVTARNGDNEGGAPVSIIEMMATGMPVVSTFHCDIPNVVVNEITGFLAPERDSDALTIQLRRALSCEARWCEIGAAARRRVEVEFDARRQGLRLSALYREAVHLSSKNKAAAFFRGGLFVA